jgi:glycosyltransferase involved in cell wall biosynthesis
MKLLWISQNLPYPPKTGVLQRNYNLIREASRFADVHLVAILKEDILPTFDEEVARRELGKLCSRIDVVRLPVEASKLRFLALALKSLFTEDPFTANWAASGTLERVLRDALSSSRYDAVYFDTISLARYRPLVNGTATVLNHHNIESHLFERRLAYEGNPLRRFYFGIEARKLHRYEQRVAHAFDTHFVCSTLDGDRLRDIAPGVSTAVVANGVDVDYFRSSGTAQETGHMVMVSGMNWFPNRDAVLYMIRDIWPSLSRALPDARLTIVGASPPAEVVELTARDSRVVATGFVDDVRPYMERAAVYLCPMRDGGGTRLKILDALSMGKAIVATTMALEGIDVEPERDVLVADTPEEFVRQTVRAVNDTAVRERLGRNARSFAERHFAWPVIGRQMQHTFAAVAAAGDRHA